MVKLRLEWATSPRIKGRKQNTNKIIKKKQAHYEGKRYVKGLVVRQVLNGKT